jgi:hypothetical protein
MLAIITQAIEIHCKKLRLSDKKTSPERAANAGSKLIKILKVFAGSFSTLPFQENGKALDKIATPKPFRKMTGVILKTAPSQIVKGIITRLANNIPVVTASLPSIILATLPPITIYNAQNTPARKANPRPNRST